ncbi:MAG: hypothetical protein ACRDWH_11755 [Acidimicrobiia bacterium]
MTSQPESPVANPSAPSLGKPAVAVVVLSSLDRSPDETLTAASRQVYVPAQILVVGSKPNPDASEVEHPPFDRLGSTEEILDRLADGIDFVWFVHTDTRPRPDALMALVRETVRHDASVAGSKVLIDGSEGRLDSVGEATDVYGDPYSGLDPGELDLEQYDVVREVAMVSPISLLVRRDLLRGLRGLDPQMPLDAAGLDLSQRARLAGGRVIVVPSSEVFHPEDCPDHQPGWRQLAGRQRAMLIAYRPITLAWVVPIGVLTHLADSLGQIVLGRLRPLLATLAAGLWNVIMLPSTWAARRRLRRIRQVGDEELFRFQVRGSIALRRTFSELGERFSRALDEEENHSIAERTAHAWARPTALLTLLSTLGVLIATRVIWFAGSPVAGFSLPPGGGWGGLLAAYGGGWDAAGLGTAVPAPPLIGFGSVATFLTGGRPQLAASIMTIAAFTAGLGGTIRLARRAGAGSGAGHAAGWVFVAGATASAVSGAGQWPLLLAAGALPWALDAVFASPASEPRRRLGQYARGGLAAGLATLAYPPVAVVIPITGILFAAFTRRWRSAIGALAITGVGLGLVAPYVVAGNLWPLFTAAKLPTIEPAWLWPVSVVVASAVGVALSGRARLSTVGLGVMLAGGGWLAVRSPALLPGVAMVGLLAASVGGALLVAAVVEVATGPSWRRIVGLMAAALLVAPAILTAAGGRAGLPVDRWSDRLSFVATLSDHPASTRVLVIGPAADLPGASRVLGSVSYRLIDGGSITLDQAYLPAARSGDRELADVIERHLIRGIDLRPGAALAEFGVGWVVVLPGGEFTIDALERQVDLALRPVDPEFDVFENLAPSSRAVTATGTVWEWTGTSYRGPASVGRVRLADNLDPGWGPDWGAEEWANSVSAGGGRADFDADALLRTWGIGSAVWLVVLVITSWWGRSTIGRTRPSNPEDQVMKEPVAAR